MSKCEAQEFSKFHPELKFDKIKEHVLLFEFMENHFQIRNMVSLLQSLHNHALDVYFYVSVYLSFEDLVFIP